MYIQIREKTYEEGGRGSYMLFFKHDGRRLCIDATEEDGTYGRLINHSKKNSCLLLKVLPVDGKPRIIFFASRDIALGEQILYDYGETRREVIEANEWMRE